MHSKGVQRDLGPGGARERAERAACRERVVICMCIVAERTELGLIRHFLPYPENDIQYYKSIINCRLAEIKRNFNRCSLKKFWTPLHQTNIM